MTWPKVPCPCNCHNALFRHLAEVKEHKTCHACAEALDAEQLDLEDRLFKKAVSLEREACAQVAEENGSPKTAALIRARGKA